MSAAQLQSHSFSYCIRREAGYCSIGYNQVNGATIDAFELSDDADTVFVSFFKMSYLASEFTLSQENHVFIMQFAKLEIRLLIN